jgi:lipid-A-disaccharide synthase
MHALNHQKVLIIAGEASGDLHGANLVTSVLARQSNLKFFGMGGSKMRAAGVKTLIDIKDLAIVGLVEVITQFGKIIDAFRTMKKALAQERPGLVILIDYPGFNLRMAKIAKKFGCRVLYYISPQLWAWHQSRVKIVRRYVDQMAVILPFEVDFYKRLNVNAIFVGHPLLLIAKSNFSTSVARQVFGFSQEGKVIGLFPGSRKSELKFLLPVMLQAAQLIKLHYPETEFVLPLALAFQDENVKTYLEKVPFQVTIIKNQTYEVIQSCDAIIAASGTVTLEITLFGKPLVLIYKGSWLNYLLAKLVAKVKFLGLSNIIAGKEIIPEFLQSRATAENIAVAMVKILADEKYRAEMVLQLLSVRKMLEVPVDVSIEQLVLKMVN